ncbi:MAG: proteasome accessory factor PafA2 family protein [Acidimicrobiia bacterium]
MNASERAAAEWARAPGSVVIGCEHELGISVRPTEACDGWDSAAGLILAVGGLDIGRCACCQFLHNGARLYIDCGQHLEYATPECTSARELVGADAAGTRILAAMAKAAEDHLTGIRPDVRIRVIKNNVSTNGASWGAHENYQVPVSLAWSDLADGLASFLASRVVFCGAGTVVASRSDATNRFRVSQRAPFTTDLAGISAAHPDGYKPMVLTRNEPLADSSRFRRIQIVCGDANVLQMSTFLKVGTTALCLRLIANGTAPALRLQDPVHAFRRFGEDDTLRAYVITEKGRYTGLDLQELWLDAVLRSNEIVADDDDQAVVTAWADIVADLRRDPAATADRVDWVAKRQLLMAIDEPTVSGCHPTPGGAGRAIAADLAYHDVRADRSTAGVLASHGRSLVLVDDATIATLMNEPPSSTRAHLRAALIDVLADADVNHHMNWSACDLILPGEAVRLVFEDAHQTDDTAANPVLAHARDVIAGSRRAKARVPGFGAHRMRTAG